MAIKIDTYTSPGVLIQEVVVPNALTIATVPQTLCLVGPGSIVKRATNEAVIRGAVPGEQLVVSGASPHTATLSHTSTEAQEDSTLYEDGVAMNVSLWQFNSSTQIQINDAAYDPGAVYTIDYVAEDTDRDFLLNEAVQAAVRIGAFANTTTYAENIDYKLDSAARLNGAVNDTYDLSVNDQLYLQVDGLPQVAITVAGAAPAASTAAEVVSDINAALVADLNYGISYGNVASVYNSDQVRLTSPLSSSTSQIRINSGATNAAPAIFGISAFPFIADNDCVNWDLDQAAELEGTPVITTVDLSTNTVLEVALDSLVDGAIAAEFTSLLAGPYNTVGLNVLRLNVDGRGNIDITLTSGAAVTAATIVSEINAALLASATYGSTYSSVASVVATNRVRLTSPTTGTTGSVEILDEGVTSAHNSVFDLEDIAVPLLQGGDGTVVCPIEGAVPAATTIAEVIADINARLADHSEYGSAYSAVAQNNGTDRLRLLSPLQGTTSKIRVVEAQTASAHVALLGLTTAQLPYDVQGTGTRPSVASVYFVTYDYERPSSDYNTAVRVYNQDQLFVQIGELAVDNPLAIAGQIAFENDAPTLFVCQVEDANGDGAYSVSDFQTAINTGLDNSGITEVCVLDTRLAVQVTLLNHVINKSSITEKKYRRGWFGMASGTAVGDMDTADTFVYRAKRTLQVVPDSPGRGRMILCAPATVDRTIVLPDSGQEVVVDLDSTYVAAAVAARHTSFTSVATALARKQITGFNTGTFETYLDAERHQLAPAGVLVVTQDAGRLVMLDPVTTEAGGGGLISFAQISAGAQKDNAVRAVTQAVDANLVGIVPEDLTDFIFDIKTTIATVLIGLIQTGAIGPFRDDAGNSRDINLASDIQVFQNALDPTKYDFRFYFNLRYPALRFWGEFSVDNPWFSVGETAATS